MSKFLIVFFCLVGSLGVVKSEVSPAPVDPNHWLIQAIDRNSKLLGVFASNAEDGRFFYETCPLAVSFYRENVPWTLSDKFGQENLIAYYQKSLMEPAEIVGILRVINAMKFKRKRELLEVVTAIHMLGDPKEEFPCPKQVNGKWTWVQMSAEDFLEYVKNR